MNRTQLLLASTALGTSLITGCATQLQLQDYAQVLPIHVNVTPHIQKACPQLQDVQLKTLSLQGVPHFEIDEKAIFSLNGEVVGADGMAQVLFSNGGLLTNDEAFTDGPISEITKHPNLSALFYINSKGGNADAFNKAINALTQRESVTFTYATTQALSGGFNVLINGDWRFTNHDTQLMTHPIKLSINENQTLPESAIPSLSALFYLKGFDLELFDSEFFDPKLLDSKLFWNTLKKDLQGAKKTATQFMKDKSSTGITKKCASSLHNDNYDTFMTPESALRLGFVDAVINEVNGTITYRLKETKPLPEGLPFKPPFVVTSPPLG